MAIGMIGVGYQTARIITLPSASFWLQYCLYYGNAFTIECPTGSGRQMNLYEVFYEYFHGDTGAGVGASHQTGWTGAIARIMRLFAVTEAEQVLEQGKGNTVGTVGDQPNQ